MQASSSKAEGGLVEHAAAVRGPGEEAVQSKQGPY